MQRCLYCQERSVILRNEAELRRYAVFLQDSFRHYSTYLKDGVFRNLNVGGGTPSLLSPDDLKGIFGTLTKSIRFSPEGERTFEFDPTFITPEKIRLLRKFGFNRLSFGVQSLDPKILKNEGRQYQTLQKIIEVIEVSRGAGLDNINIDLMMGLKDDSPQKFIHSFRTVAGLGPRSISVYPFNPTRRYLDALHWDKDTYYRHFLRIYREVQEEMGKAASDLGYKAFYMSQNSIQIEFFKDGESNPGGYERNYPSSCFSVGRFSISRLFGSGMYCHDALGDGFDPDRPVMSRIHSLDSGKERLLYAFRAIARDAPIDYRDYKRVFGSEFLEDFNDQIKLLAGLSKLEVGEDRAYFLPRDPKSRYFYSLLFLKKDDLIRWVDSLREPDA